MKILFPILSVCLLLGCGNADKNVMSKGEEAINSSHNEERPYSKKEKEYVQMILDGKNEDLLKLTRSDSEVDKDYHKLAYIFLNSPSAQALEEEDANDALEEADMMLTYIKQLKLIRPEIEGKIDELKIRYEEPVAKYHENNLAMKKESEAILKKIESQKVHIGMTSDDALNSFWGKPSDINRTTTVYGTKEQWVYPGGKYLYFNNGILEAIQE